MFFCLQLAARRVFCFCALLILINGVLGCSKIEVPKEPVRAVKLHAVSGSALNVNGEYSAEVRARVESRLGFQVAGKLGQRPAEQGQRVVAGQLLAQIDANDYQLALQAANAQVSAAQSQRDLVSADFKRFEALKSQNFISSAELERREAAVKAADAALNQAKAQAQVQSNQAGYTRLLATHAGVITAVDAEVGQVLAAGQPVLRLAHDGPRDAVFAVSESTLMALKVGQPMQAKLASSGQVFKGKVRELAASADPITRTYAVKLALEASDRLPLGATLHVLAPNLSGSQPEVIKLPTSAIRQEGQTTVVWVLDENTMTVNTQEVQLGPLTGNDVVIASGLRSGQRVVSAGVHVLTAGQKVSVYRATDAQAPGVSTALPTSSSQR